MEVCWPFCSSWELDRDAACWEVDCEVACEVDGWFPFCADIIYLLISYFYNLTIPHRFNSARNLMCDVVSTAIPVFSDLRFCQGAEDPAQA
jgi:hypothetical protein